MVRRLIVVVLLGVVGLVIFSQTDPVPKSEAQILLVAVSFGLMGGAIGGVMIVLGRFVRREPLWQVKSEKFESPRIFYVGIAFFGGMGILALSTGRPLLAAFFIIASLLYAAGLAAYQRGWRG